MTRHTTTMWAITGQWADHSKPFLYTGTYFTRREAIEDFVRNSTATWEDYRREGVRVVKVTLTWEATP